MVQIIIDYDKCDGEDECGDCVDLCTMEVLKWVNGKVEPVDIDECSLCETCVDLCPNECIKIIAD